MDVKSLVAFEPVVDLGMLVYGVIVDNQMQIEFGGRFSVDLFQESERFLMPMLRHALRNDFSLSHFHRGK